MIQNVTICSISNAEKTLLPKNDTLLIKVGAESVPIISYEELYFDSLALSFAADILPNKNKQTITNTQAHKIIKRINLANKTDKAIDIVICCDSKKIISNAIGMYVKERYPKAKLNSMIEKNSTSQHIFNLIKMNSFRQENGIVKSMSKLLDPNEITNMISNTCSQIRKNPKGMTKLFIKWVKYNF